MVGYGPGGTGDLTARLNFIAEGNFAMTPALFKSLPFDPVRDFETVSPIASSGFALAVDAASPIKEVKDLIAQADVKQKFLELGITAGGNTPEQMLELPKTDIAWWREVVAKAKIEKR